MQHVGWWLIQNQFIKAMHNGLRKTFQDLILMCFKILIPQQRFGKTFAKVKTQKIPIFSKLPHYFYSLNFFVLPQYCKDA